MMRRVFLQSFEMLVKKHETAIAYKGRFEQFILAKSCNGGYEIWMNGI